MILVKNLLNIFGIFIEDYRVENVKIVKEIDEILSNALLFSLIWSVGAALEETCREQFNQMILQIINDASKLEIPIETTYEHPVLTIPNRFYPYSNLFELIYDKNKNTWVAWT